METREAFPSSCGLPRPAESASDHAPCCQSWDRLVSRFPSRVFRWQGGLTHKPAPLKGRVLDFSRTSALIAVPALHSYDSMRPSSAPQGHSPDQYACSRRAHDLVPGGIYASRCPAKQRRGISFPLFGGPRRISTETGSKRSLTRGERKSSISRTAHEESGFLQSDSRWFCYNRWRMHSGPERTGQPRYPVAASLSHTVRARPRKEQIRRGCMTRISTIVRRIH
jgi:hypothetical protein